MKKIILLPALIILSLQSKSQVTHFEAEAGITLRKIPTDHDFRFFTHYSKESRSRPHAGYSVEVSTDPKTFGYSIGYMYHLQSFNFFSVEISAGPEFDFKYESQKINVGLLGSLSLSTKINYEIAKWKVLCFFATTFSKEDRWWHEAYAVVSLPLPWISLGIHHQTYSVYPGALIHINLPGGMRYFFSSDGHRQLIGLSFSSISGVLR